jgi:hypothetical protein
MCIRDSSYPTVRAKLDELMEHLPPALAKPAPDARRTILAQVQSGQLTADEAIALLRQEAKDIP